MAEASLVARLGECKTQEELSDLLYALAEEGGSAAIEPLAVWIEESDGEMRQLAQTTLERIRARLPAAEKAQAAAILESVRKRDRARNRPGDSLVNRAADPTGRIPSRPLPVGAARNSRTVAAARPASAILPAAVPPQPAETPSMPGVASAMPRLLRPVKPYAAKLSQILTEAIGRRASDVHIRTGSRPCFRVDGRMVESDLPPLEAAMARWLAYRLLDDNRRIAFESGDEQDLAVEKPALGRFRVNVFQDIEGPGLVVRILTNEVRRLSDIGAPSVLERFCKATRGLILVTGPTGCGKSTTVAAMLDYINEHREAHILTIEDPVEFVHKPKKCRITQREVGSNTRSFASALRSALRQDPDVIMVGEMRDLETIELAMTAAETGHLVFSTLHTQTAPKTLDRIVGAFPANRADQIKTMLAETLLAVVSQVLVPKAKGGGRVAAHEVMFRTSAIANLIREGKIYQIPNAMLAGQNQGMRMMDEQLAALVKSGDISFEDAMTHAADPEELRHRSL